MFIDIFYEFLAHLHKKVCIPALDTFSCLLSLKQNKKGFVLIYIVNACDTLKSKVNKSFVDMDQEYSEIQNTYNFLMFSM